MEDFLFSELSSEEFKAYFIEEFCKAPKQKKKKQETLQKILNKISKYDEPFAIQLMETSILNDYQGITFSDTDVKYSNYLKAKSGNHQQGGSTLYGKASKSNYLREISDSINQSFWRNSNKQVFPKATTWRVDSYRYAYGSKME